MKKQVLFFIFLASLTLVAIQGCEDDDTTTDVNSTPEFTSLSDKVSSLPGEKFVFEATVTDPAGIRTVNMKYAPWFLDKTINPQLKHCLNALILAEAGSQKDFYIR